MHLRHVIATTTQAIMLGWMLASTSAAGEVIKIDLGEPLRDPAICRGSDGVYYLTGTGGTPAIPAYGPLDFANNDGIRVWKSRDLRAWELVGKVFDLVEAKNERTLDADWWRIPAPAGAAMGKPVRGAYAPKIYQFGDTFWIVFSINGQGAGILVSQTGKPEGPYVLANKTDNPGPGKNPRPRALISEAGSPSLFRDEDGKTYLLWGEGWLAPLRDDGGAVAGEPIPLLCDMETQPWIRLGQRGYVLTRIHGRYLLTAEACSYRDGAVHGDVYAAWSDRLAGPYHDRHVLIADARATTILPDADGALLATWWNTLGAPAAEDRVGILRLPVPSPGK
jgi:hypothetical protein